MTEYGQGALAQETKRAQKPDNKRQPTPMSLLTYLVVATAGDYSIEVTTNGDETYGVCAAFYPAA